MTAPRNRAGRFSAAVAGVLVLVGLAALTGLRAAPAAAAVPAAIPAAVPAVPGLSLRLDSMDPRIVTETGPTSLTVTGELTNNGSRAVSGIEIRVQRSDQLRTETDVRNALSGAGAADSVTPNFTDLNGPVLPGEHRPIKVTIPLRGSPDSSLALRAPGTYDLLVNVNGVPDKDVRARLTAARMLLPVLSLPPAPAPGQAAGQATASAPGPAVVPTAGPPVGATLLYPLADVPRLLPTGPGEPTVLTDDTLAGSLAAGGRLAGLLQALEQNAPTGSAVRKGICLAVDPALLTTVAAMSGGYRVLNPDGSQTDGRGADAARQWLASLKSAAHGSCVVSLPFADADLVALSRGGLADLGGYAVQTGGQITATLLDTPVLPNTTWPADEAMDDRSLSDFTALGGRTVLLATDAVNGTRAAKMSGIVEIAGTSTGTAGTGIGPAAVLTDPLLSTAAAGRADASPAATPTTPTTPTTVTTTAPAGTDGGLSTQDAIGTLAFRATDPAAATNPPIVLAPPHRWNADNAEASQLIDAFATLVGAGRLSTRSLAEVVAAGPPEGNPTSRLVYPARVSSREIPGSAIEPLRTDRDTADQLRAAAESEQGVGSTPAEVFTPVTEGLVAAASAAWRGDPALADRAVATMSTRIQQLRSLVTVVEPPGPYSLGSSDAPLLLTVSNGLPVAMNVRIELSATSGLRTDPIAVQRVPPLGRLQLRVNTEATRSGQFSVEASVSTPNGTPLGTPSRILVRSGVYGTIALWLTGTAGVLLVVLAGRRILRRIRHEPARRPRADPPPTGPSADSPSPSDPPTPTPTPTPPDQDREPTSSTGSQAR